MTRGALTTFSIANDVAKYFAIIPAMFVAFYPQLQALNVMHLQTPQSAILSAIIFNALIIVALIPLALRGVQLSPGRRLGGAAAQSADLRRGRRRRAVHRHQADRHGDHRHRPCVRITAMLKEIRPAIVMILLMTVLTGLAYPLAMTGIAQAVFPHQANGSLIEKDGKVIGSELIGQNFTSRAISTAVRRPRPTPIRRIRPRRVPAPYNAANSSGSNAGPTSKSLIERVQEDVKASRRRTPTRRCRSTWSPPRPAASTPTSRRRRPCSRCRAWPRSAACRRRRCASWSRQHTQGRFFGVIGEPRVNVLQLNLALDALKTQ